jgi:hypothetical protein
MKKKAILCSVIFIFFNFFGCSPSFEDNIRILVKGVIKDQENNPISNAEIKVYTRDASGFFTFSDSEYLLGQNTSQSNGVFAVTSMFDKDADFSIQINAGVNYTKYVYQTSTENYTPSDLVFNLETIVLKQLGNVNFNITRTSGEGNTIQFSFKYVNDLCVEFFDEGVIDTNQSFCFEELTIGTTLGDNRPDFENNFIIPFGTIVEFTYSINEQPEVIETFIINQENYEFLFNY